jgi:hypothetical protein
MQWMHDLDSKTYRLVPRRAREEDFLIFAFIEDPAKEPGAPEKHELWHRKFDKMMKIRLWKGGSETPSSILD